MLNVEENGIDNTLRFKCNVHAATPCISDSRFLCDSRGVRVYTDGTVNGRVVRKYRHVKRKKPVILYWVGFESRHQFDALNPATVKQNEADRQMLLKLLRDMGVDVQGNEPLHVLGKSYNFYDPHMAHTRVKSNDTSKQIPIIGMKGDPEKVGASPADEYERKTLIEWLTEHGESVHPNTGLLKLRAKKAAKLEDLADKE